MLGCRIYNVRLFFYFSSFINFMTQQEGHVCCTGGVHTHEAPLTSCSDTWPKQTLFVVASILEVSFSHDVRLQSFIKKKKNGDTT